MGLYERALTSAYINVELLVRIVKRVYEHYQNLPLSVENDLEVIICADGRNVFHHEKSFLK